MRAFISYSSKDRGCIGGLAEDMELFDYTVWYDRELNRQGGHKWWALILGEIRVCDVFVYALSPHILESEACRREYRYAKALNKPILPVLVAEVDVHRLPLELQEQQFINYSLRSRDQLGKLRDSLRHLPPAPPLPDPLPEEPPTPLDPVSAVIDRIENLTTDANQQKVLATDIYALKDDKNRAAQVPELLRHLLKREDVLTVRNLKLIQELLGASVASVPAADAPAAKPSSQPQTVEPLAPPVGQPHKSLALQELQGIFGFTDQDLETNRANQLTDEQFKQVRKNDTESGYELGCTWTFVLVGGSVLLAMLLLGGLPDFVRWPLGTIATLTLLIALGFLPNAVKKRRAYAKKVTAEKYIKVLTGELRYSDEGYTYIGKEAINIQRFTKAKKEKWSSYRGTYPGSYRAYMLNMPGDYKPNLLSIEPLKDK